MPNMTLDEKYQALLEEIDNMEFPSGAHLQLFNAVRDIRRAPSRVEVEPINIYFQFLLQNDQTCIKYKITVISKEIITQSDSVFITDSCLINYKIQKEENELTFKKPRDDFFYHILKYLQHACEMYVYHSFEEDRFFGYSLRFDNINSLVAYYSRRERDECHLCSYSLGGCEKKSEHNLSLKWSVLKMLGLEYNISLRRTL